MNKTTQWAQTVYERLAEDDDGRVCTDISDEACRETPGNFILTLFANTFSSLADKLASAKTTLPWVLQQTGAPVGLISVLVPIRESGSMLPQMLIGAVVRRQPVRKWIWVGGGAIQSLCLALMAWSALSLTGMAAGLSIVTLLIVFSLARGACSVAYKDVLGKTIPRTRRGRLSGWISAVAGLAALLTGVVISGFVPSQQTPQASTGMGLYVVLLLTAACAWLLAIVCYARITEFEGETDGGANGVSEALQRWSLLRDDKKFRRFVIARALAMGSGLVAPFYVALAQGIPGSSAAMLGALIAAEGLAGLVSSPFWGRWADDNSQRVFAAGSAMAASISLAVVFWSWTLAESEFTSAFYVFAFFVLGVSHAGVRLGRKTWLVDMADGNKRTDYVAVSNSAIGVILLLSGLLGALAALVSVQLTIVLLAVGGFAGAFLSARPHRA